MSVETIHLAEVLAEAGVGVGAEVPTGLSKVPEVVDIVLATVPSLVLPCSNSRWIHSTSRTYPVGVEGNMQTTTRTKGAWRVSLYPHIHRFHIGMVEHDANVS